MATGEASMPGRWLVVFLGFVANYMAGLFLNTFGVFLAPLSKAFAASETALVAAPMAYLAVMSVVSPFIGILLDRLPMRRMMIGASAVVATGLVCLGLCGSLRQYLVCVALLVALPAQAAGTAAGMKLAAAAVPQRPGLALGVAALGVSFSSMSLPAAAMLLLEWFDWRMSYMVLAIGMVAILWPLAFLLAPRQTTGRALVSPSGIYREMRSFVAVPGFWWIALLVGAQMSTIAVLSINLIELAKGHGFGKSEQALLVSLLGGLALAGKLLWGMALDRFPSRIVTWVALAVQASGLVILCVGSSLPVVAIGCALTGLSVGAVIPLQSLLIGRVLGWKNFAAAYGASALATQPIILAAIFLAARSRDLTGNYSWAIFMLVSLTGVAAAANAAIKADPSRGRSDESATGG